MYKFSNGATGTQLADIEVKQIRFTEGVSFVGTLAKVDSNHECLVLN